MRMGKVLTFAGIFVCIASQATVQAVFVVETFSDGRGYANFSSNGTPSYATAVSRAAGCIGTKSAFGGTVDPDTYIFSYTLGVDADNFSIAAGTNLGNNLLASGLTGGLPGTYNVYITWPSTNNVAPVPGNVTATLVDDDGSVNVGFSQNDGDVYGTNPGGNKWKLLGQVSLSLGTTSTVTLVPDVPGSYVSMRAQGVMWELVEAAPQLATLVETDGVTTVSEDGDIDTYTVVLNEQPDHDVVVLAQVMDPNQIFLNGQINAAQLTFTPANWDIAQVVTVAALDDSLVEGDHTQSILHTTAYADPNSSDPNSFWNNGFAGLLQVTITDNEVAGVRIVETEGTTKVSEQGPTQDSYTMRLSIQPTDPVTITIATDGQTLVDTGLGAGQTASLVFTAADWAIEKAVTVIAVDDAVFEGDHTSPVTHTVSSLDGGYDGLTVDNVSVSVTDNDCGAWGFHVMDFDKNCFVDLADLAEFAAAWLECTQPYYENCVDLR
ncbi:MAG: hypothetical protein JXB18_03325 [Sedimentisphaerales bacterium]|nr:hypothetical protein [Sedimentisphaerales bacterium]